MWPDELADFSRTLASVVFFISNIELWRSVDYFSEASEVNPLLHTWSLAVEEQYYMLFPIFVILLWRFGHKFLVLGLGVATFSSFALAEFAWWRWPVTNFYLLPTRAWELGLGSLLAFYRFQRTLRCPVVVSQAGAMAGIGLILAGVVLFSATTPFPSRYALLPTLGTVMVILFSGPGTLVGRILSLRPIVFIGMISYSAYLWHQPVFAFTRLGALYPPGPLLMLGLSVFSLLLAAASWRFVEQPFRDSSLIRTSTVIRAGTGASMALVMIALVLPSAPPAGSYASDAPGLLAGC
jgi:peptidoglycan/LPS O-acetylase OafA/YrhL